MTVHRWCPYCGEPTTQDVMGDGQALCLTCGAMLPAPR